MLTRRNQLGIVTWDIQKIKCWLDFLNGWCVNGKNGRMAKI